jgi:hypothetical protein
MSGCHGPSKVTLRPFGRRFFHYLNQISIGPPNRTLLQFHDTISFDFLNMLYGVLIYDLIFDVQV